VSSWNLPRAVAGAISSVPLLGFWVVTGLGQLGISHTWLQKLIRECQVEPTEMYRDVRLCGNPAYPELIRVRERTRKIWNNGELQSWLTAFL